MKTAADSSPKTGFAPVASAGLSLIVLMVSLASLSSQRQIWEKIPQTERWISSASATGSLSLLGLTVAYIYSPRKAFGRILAAGLAIMAGCLLIPGLRYWTESPGHGGSFAGIGYAIALAAILLGAGAGITAIGILRSSQRQK
jgi:hypothetical protein